MSSKTGKIILLNGVSSSGKSAIIDEIKKIDCNIKILKIDDWFPAILHKKATSLGWNKESNIDPWIYLYEYVYKKTGKYFFNIEVREMLFDKDTEFYQKAKDFAQNGQSVIIDTVLEYENEYKSFDDFFKSDKVLKVLVYCPMDVLLERVEKRNSSAVAEEHRTAFQSFEQFPAIFNVQGNRTNTVVDVVKSSVLKQALEKAVQDLIKQRIPDPYLPKIQQFKIDFIKQFNLDEKEEIILFSKHTYDLILNSSKNTTTECAKEIIKLFK